MRMPFVKAISSLLFVQRPMLKVKRLGSSLPVIVMVRDLLNALPKFDYLTRSGTKRNTHNLTEETRKKNRRSRRCECPMFCVASKANGGLWELSIRNSEHNHGPAEPTPKKKKDMPPPHSSESVNLPLLQTPSHCIADFCIIPIGGSNPSVAHEVAEVQRLLKRSGLIFHMHSAGTTVEGTWDDVMRIIGQAHSLLHGSGVIRLQSDIRIGTRTDKKQSAEDKMAAVHAHLHGLDMSGQVGSDDGMDESEMPSEMQSELQEHSQLGHMSHGMSPAIAPELERMAPSIPPHPPQMSHVMDYKSVPSMGQQGMGQHHPMAPHLHHQMPPTHRGVPPNGYQGGP